MKRSNSVVPALFVGLAALIPAAASAQEAPEPASAADQLPPVDVIQQQATPAPAAKKKSAAKKKQVSPAPQGPGTYVTESAAVGNARGPDGRPVDASPSLSPVDPANGILPADLQDFPGSANRVTRTEIDDERPLTTHEALRNVPGVVTVTDDGLSRHAGIGIRGSNFRRSRKILITEDGQSINLSTYIDPSVHYTPPLDRVESVEVLRGAVVSQGPLNNYGIINFQNLNPFGPTETIIKGVLSHTDGANKEIGNYRHVHTRQNAGNVGVVASYTGSDAGGAWDNEVLRFNDFYGAIGWRDSSQDLTVSGAYFRQRDNYDEDNFVGTAEEFFANHRWKSNNPDIGDGATDVNTYNADYYRLQLAHNLYIDDNTTLSTRAYMGDHERNRFASREPFGADHYMRGRNRHYQQYGIDSRLQFSNIALGGGLTHDFQIGAKYEHQSLRNCTSFGVVGEILDANNKGNCRAVKNVGGYEKDGEIQKFEADAFAAFAQSAIHLSPSLTVTPGVRFESYRVRGAEVYGGTDTGKSNHDLVLPSLAFAWEAGNRTTFYGGYHRGFSPYIARDAALDEWPMDEEIGDNFEVGVRSKALTGFTFEAAYFHSFIDGYQLKESYTTGNNDGVFGTLDEVEIKGVELLARLDSRPITGGAWNFFGEAVYTYTDAKIKSGMDSIFGDFDKFNAPLLDVSGNRLPFSIPHFANLTMGVAYKKLWDASMTWTYRGDFFTNAQNSGPLTCVDEDGTSTAEGDGVFTGCYGGDEMVGGKVDDVWLLSARSNFNVTDNLTLFVAGSNLTNKFYINELSDGAKPGLGRTIYGGFTLKLQ